MLSIDFIRKNKEKVIESTKNKNREADIDKLLLLDDERRGYIQQIQKLREERNELAKKRDDSVKTRGKEIKEELKEAETKLADLEIALQNMLAYVPNVPLDEVPVGKDESANVEIKTWGKPKMFSFTPKSHIDIAKDLDLIDFERGSKVSGFRGYFLKNQLAVLHMGLLMYVFQKLSQKGYTPVVAPSIVKGFSMFGTAQFPWGEPEVYKLNDDDAYLSGTAEVPVTSYYANETLNEKDLPKKFVAFSPCFRREAGSYGKDTKGLYRVHEFWKIEQVLIGKNDMDAARELHKELQANSEEILEELGLPYRVLLMCTGDMGEPQVLKYDTETWMPERNAYGETMSNSIMGDYQARRLGIKYKTAEGKTEYCYTLNNTAVASPRILIALLENFQQEDGSVEIPHVLRPFVGFSSIAK
ncbi:serine--tRNA ligase [Candidatus Microgenomates bacterium]|nr:serine--tRNA ligase [Candidatus Microgenomates bacterium]